MTRTLLKRIAETTAGDSKRRLLAWAALLSILVVICSTLYSRKTAAALELKKEQQLYQWIYMQPEPEEEPVQDTPPLISIAIEAANRHNLLIGRLQPKGEDVLICSFTGVRFSSLLLWLDELKAANTELSFPKIFINQDSSESTGFVNASVYLSK